MAIKARSLSAVINASEFAKRNIGEKNTSPSPPAATEQQNKSRLLIPIRILPLLTLVVYCTHRL